MYHAHIQEEFLGKLLNGQKRIEGRIHRDKWKEMKIGGILVFNDYHSFTITDVRCYLNFGMMLVNEGIRHVLPGVTGDLTTAIHIYDQLYHCPKDVLDIEKHGVVAIELRYLATGAEWKLRER